MSHDALDALDARRSQLDLAPLATLAGRFHSHVTLRVTATLDDAERGRLEALATAERSKLTVIELADLATRTERDVMLTRYFVDPMPGALGRIASALRATVETLLAAAIDPVRVKVEHESLPSLRTFDAERYHEVHIKLAIPADGYDATYAWLKTAGAAHGWRPSRNPYERRSGGITQFVTMRAYDGDRAAIDARVGTAVAALRAQGLTPVEIKRETTVLDTRRAHDSWWV